MSEIVVALGGEALAVAQCEHVVDLHAMIVGMVLRQGLNDMARHTGTLRHHQRVTVMDGTDGFLGCHQPLFIFRFPIHTHLILAMSLASCFLLSRSLWRLIMIRWA